MKKLVYGSNRDEYLSNISINRIHQYTPDSNFDQLESRKANLLVESVLIFYQVDKYNKKQREMVEMVLDIDDNCVLMAENKENVSDKLIDKVDDVEKMGETKKDTFFSKLKPVFTDDFDQEDVERMKQLPSKIIIEKIGTADRRRFPYMNEVVDFVNMRLFDANDEILHSYIAEKVHIPDRTMFYGDKKEKNFKKLVKQLMELEDMSKQEIERNIGVLTLKHFEEIDLPKSFKIQVTGGREESLYEVTEDEEEQFMSLR